MTTAERQQFVKDETRRILRGWTPKGAADTYSGVQWDIARAKARKALGEYLFALRKNREAAQAIIERGGPKPRVDLDAVVAEAFSRR